MKHSVKNRNGHSAAAGFESAIREPLPRTTVAGLETRSLGVAAGATPSVRSPQGPGPVARITEPKSSSRPSHEQIARRAYEIFLSRNGAEGSPEQDWLRAERELTASGGSQA